MRISWFLKEIQYREVLHRLTGNVLKNGEEDE